MDKENNNLQPASDLTGDEYQRAVEEQQDAIKAAEIKLNELKNLPRNIKISQQVFDKLNSKRKNSEETDEELLTRLLSDLVDESTEKNDDTSIPLLIYELLGFMMCHQEISDFWNETILDSRNVNFYIKHFANASKEYLYHLWKKLHPYWDDDVIKTTFNEKFGDRETWDKRYAIYLKYLEDNGEHSVNHSTRVGRFQLGAWVSRTIKMLDAINYRVELDAGQQLDGRYLGKTDLIEAFLQVSGIFEHAPWEQYNRPGANRPNWQIRLDNCMRNTAVRTEQNVSDLFDSVIPGVNEVMEETEGHAEEEFSLARETVIGERMVEAIVQYIQDDLEALANKKKGLPLLVNQNFITHTHVLFSTSSPFSLWNYISLDVDNYLVYKLKVIDGKGLSEGITLGIYSDVEAFFFDPENPGKKSEPVASPIDAAHAKKSGIDMSITRHSREVFSHPAEIATKLFSDQGLQIAVHAGGLSESCDFISGYTSWKDKSIVVELPYERLTPIDPLVVLQWNNYIIMDGYQSLYNEAIGKTKQWSTHNFSKELTFEIIVELTIAFANFVDYIKTYFYKANNHDEFYKTGLDLKLSIDESPIASSMINLDLASQLIENEQYVLFGYKKLFESTIELPEGARFMSPQNLFRLAVKQASLNREDWLPDHAAFDALVESRFRNRVLDKSIAPTDSFSWPVMYFGEEDKFEIGKEIIIQTVRTREQYVFSTKCPVCSGLMEQTAEVGINALNQVFEDFQIITLMCAGELSRETPCENIIHLTSKKKEGDSWELTWR